MKYIYFVLLLCPCPIVYGQSVEPLDAELELNDEVLATEEPVESDLTDLDAGGMPFMFTMTAGSVESVGRILLSSSDGAAKGVPIVVESEQGLDATPVHFELYQNYPNPFNPTTTLEFDLPNPSIVTLKVYNALGQEVATVIPGEFMDEGTQEVELDASVLPSGVYFYRIVAKGISLNDEQTQTSSESFTSVKKMILLR